MSVAVVSTTPVVSVAVLTGVPLAEAISVTGTSRPVSEPADLNTASVAVGSATADDTCAAGKFKCLLYEFCQSIVAEARKLVKKKFSGV